MEWSPHAPVWFVRVAVATLVLNPRLCGRYCRICAAFRRRYPDSPHGLRHMHNEQTISGRPATRGDHGALQMAVVFRSSCCRGADPKIRGEVGMIPSGAVLGLTDMDALTISMARGASAGIPCGNRGESRGHRHSRKHRAKLVVALVLGGVGFRRVVGAESGCQWYAIMASLAWEDANACFATSDCARS